MGYALRIINWDSNTVLCGTWQIPDANTSANPETVAKKAAIHPDPAPIFATFRIASGSWDALARKRAGGKTPRIDQCRCATPSSPPRPAHAAARSKATCQK
jgi:hypothetical protein